MNRLMLSCFAGSVLFAACVCTAQEKGLVIGHRAGSREFEENLLVSFQQSFAKGTRGFETDIRMTKDGALVILHNDSVDEMYVGHGPVEDMTVEEVKKLRSRKGGQPFLFLEELTDFFADKPGLYVEWEMKTGNEKLYPDSSIEPYCRAVYAMVMAKKPKDSLYVFTSGDLRPLKFLGATFPGAEREWNVGGMTADTLKKAKAMGFTRISCFLDLTTRQAVREAHKQGFKVTGWFGSSLNDYLYQVGMGVDVIGSNIPVAMNAWKAAHPVK